MRWHADNGQPPEPPGAAPVDTVSDAVAARRVLLIACGALAREIVDILRVNRWHHVKVLCLPAKLHNTPQKIPEAVRAKIREKRDAYDDILVLYGDCGTGGMLDRVLEEEGVERIDGPHCYAFFSGLDRFAEEAEADPACFYLTDYLVRHFDRIIWQGLGIDRHPELLEIYFRNYTRLIYLAQSEDAGLRRKAEAAAGRLGLDFEVRDTGYGDLSTYLERRARAHPVDG